jgi:hypothetical protein
MDAIVVPCLIKYQYNVTLLKWKGDRIIIDQEFLL